ncbi:putative holliday junction resolvase [Cryptosporangium aurantiacum]|uniref:Putative pre-16S rRNA nuclease n=1 Tax=Cryptosporangium aurantiacum TaxID=134849 RepID=A0A1M7RFV5_9ACTN|nr:putative holliday junction resolvase [Cryptosporangium aurantiacum]
MKRGVRLGVDVGSVRVGVAASDPSGILASPVETVPRDPKNGSDLARIVALVAEYEAVEVVVGLPRSLSGAEGRAAVAAREYADSLAERLRESPHPAPVQLSDERLTTVIAGRTLSQRGVRGKKHRAVVDQAAAVLILQAWLDAERSADQP